jgi:hypothetical protein
MGEAAMTTGPRDELEAGRGHLRASHADREQVIGVLKVAFVQGRLDRDEFDLRVSQTLASRTYAELAAVTGDLPAGLAVAQKPAPARGSVNKKKKAVAALTSATLAIAGILVAAPSIPDGSPFAVPVTLVFCLLCIAVSTGWMLLLHAWLDQRAGRPSGQGLPSGPSGQATRRPLSADPGTQLPPGDDRHWHTAEAVPIVRPRLLPS